MGNDDDDSALAAGQVIEAVSTVLQSTKAVPELFPAMEGHLMPMLVQVSYLCSYIMAVVMRRNTNNTKIEISSMVKNLDRSFLVRWSLRFFFFNVTPAITTKTISTTTSTGVTCTYWYAYV